MKLYLGCAAIALIGAFATPAAAADLGGNCCADLEERIAELEAATVRKGNRKVSLAVSGWVNEQMLFWDDGQESNVYVGGNDLERTRFRFRGEAKIDSDWSAGYTLEIGVRTERSSAYDQTTDDPAGAGFDIRKSNWWLKSKSYGKFTVGREGSATYHLLDDADFTNTRYYADAESVTTAGIPRYLLLVNSQPTNLRYTNLLSPGATNSPGNGERPDIIRYDTPDFKGFSAAVAWGEDDLWDVAGIYAGEIGDFKLAARIGYAKYTDEGTGPGADHCSDESPPDGHEECREWGGSATIQHKPTGVFIYGAWGQKKDDTIDGALNLGGANNGRVDDKDTTWYLQAGIEQKWISLGSTTLFGTFRQDELGSRQAKFSAASSGLPLGSGTFYAGGSQINTWGGGVVQNIANAAMDIYLIYENVDAEFNVTNKASGAITKFDADNLDLVQFGARIQF